MLCLAANTSPFWYALYTGTTPILDGDGYDTGEKAISYASPVKCYGNISPASGSAMTELFGTTERYDKLLVMDVLNCPPLDVNTVLCVDTEPSYDANNILLYDYVIKKIAKSAHYVSIAISKVRDS